MKYKNLFSEGKIGNLTLKNRVVMSPMSPGMAKRDGALTEEVIAFYEERAKNGVGLIIVGATKINEEHGTMEPFQLAITKDEHIEPLKKFSEAMHKHGAKVFIQLAHPGRQTFSNINEGNTVVGPSAIPCVVCREETRALTTEEVKSLVKDFVQGAVRLKSANVDGVELHAAHGYLLNEFLSPYSNKRTDEYGGNFVNRMRFLAEIIKGIREACGEDYPISVRVSVDEFLKQFGIKEQGIQLEEGVKIAKYLETLGIDVMNVSSGVYITSHTVIEPTSYEQGWRKHLAKTIKEAVNIPVIAAGVLREPTFVEQLLEDGVTDFVALGRGLVADAAWVDKGKEGRDDHIRKCISCLTCIESVAYHKPIACSLNAKAGRELKIKDLKKDGEGRVVAVIGAGPSGMEAARVLAMRGFKPVIFEKENEVGGQLQLANKPPKKEKITWFIDYELAELKKLGVEIRLNTEASVEEIRALNPYAVFVAAGSSPIVPPIDGVKGENVHMVPEILKGQVKFEGKKVVVIGSGMTGLETGEFLAERGNEITIVEMVDKIGKGIYAPNRMDVLMKLMKHKAEMLPSHKLQEITHEKIVLENLKTNELIEKEIDHVILSLGTRSNNQMIEELKNNFKNVKIIGDANELGRIVQAVEAGYTEACNL
ncbi:NAD(P)/FAD-dependent oxidoreductase [Anaeromicrobium sediminis]|uniref:NADH:flavin oxidoreductase n=1 Tax=Anaeromicrobium sediminis TaxID=1478221 RepID=A0A267MQJ9_9FIRM|nr:NAD(P)/FAD-dependent oxidoreductase [Anaeromicrobium sediminis]PAB61185.1 NADH:flavin oxidoreductase [Anaeromicrobium sediminis]